MVTESGGALDSPRMNRHDLADKVKGLAYPLTPNDLTGYDPLIDLVGDSTIVLIGDASHGTHEFYRERARITTRLIREKGFNMVAIEGDWPEGSRINEYVQGGPGSARDALDVFSVYPTWMWGNYDFLHFIEWLRRHNDAITDGDRKVSFFGIDVRDLPRASAMVIDFLQRANSDLAADAHRRYSCFDHFTGMRDPYGHRAELGITGRCKDEAVAVLDALKQHRDSLLEQTDEEQYFCALQAATVVVNGERFYETATRKDRDAGWNIRDIHMMDTLHALLHHYSGTKVVIWQHNTHVGDFRATGDAGIKVNIGQLVREQLPGESVAVGFGTYEGTVTATKDWGEQPQHMLVPPPEPESYDGIFHLTGLERFLLLLSPLRERGDTGGLDDWRGQRAIGVVYDPDDERKNSVPTRLLQRYDAYVHIDRTTAIRPLREEPAWQSPLSMDTYPSGY
ncbi:MAG: hypothetical protein NVSMB52_11290 [Chloroflexota bacterium]